MTLTTRIKGYPVTIVFDTGIITSVYIGSNSGVDLLSVLSDTFLLACYLAITDELAN